MTKEKMSEDLLNFINSETVGVISTVNVKDSKPHSSPIYYFFSSDNESFYFITKDTTQKVGNIKDNSNVDFVIFSNSPQRVFRAECSAEIVTDDEGSSEFISKLIDVHTHQEYYPTPISALKEGKLSLVRLKVLDYKYNVYKKKD